MAKIKKTDVYRLNTNPSIYDILLGSDSQSNGVTKNYMIKDILETTSEHLGAYYGTKLMSGSVIWLEDYDYKVTDLIYYINGELYESEEVIATLSEAHATLNRIDLIVANTNGDIEILEGVPSSNPTPKDIDESTQLELTFIIVEAGTTAPNGISNNLVYNENTQIIGGEWDTSTSYVSIDLESTEDFQNGSKSIKFTNSSSNDYITFNSAISIDGGEVSSFIFRIKLIEANTNQRFWVRFYNTSGPDGIGVMINNGQFGFISTLLNEWQTIIIPSTVLGITTKYFDQIRLDNRRSGFTGFIDNIIVQSGVIIPDPVQIIQDNVSKTIYVSQTQLESAIGYDVGNTQEENLANYINTLSYNKLETDSDLWVEYETDLGEKTQYRIINASKGILIITSNNLYKIIKSDSNISDHSELNLDDGTNPHNTTKSDVGLPNVDNTSDIDKPISTATQSALNLKADKTNVLELDNTTPFTPDADYEPATKKFVEDSITVGSGISNVVEDTTPQLGGSLDTNSKSIEWSKGADVASATELLLLRDGNSFDVTGTTTIATIEDTADAWKIGSIAILQFDDILTLTHSANLILPTGSDITTAAGDIAFMQKVASGDWKCVSYQRADGTPLAGGGGDMLAATYDPTNVNGDAFDMDNMVEGADTKILTAAERAAIASHTSEIAALVSSYSRRKAVIDIVDNTAAPPTEVSGDRYILDNTGSSHANWDGASAFDIVEFDGTNWVATTPLEGYIAYVDAEDKDALYIDDGSPEWQLRDISTFDLAAAINGATTKATPVDADVFNFLDSAASFILKKLTWANIKATLKTYFDTLYAVKSQTDFISGLIPAPADQDYKLIVKAPYAGTITETTTISTTGTCTATFKINTTALGGTANSVSTSEQSQAHASANTFSAGDDIVITVSSNSSCENMSFTIKFTKTLS